MLGSCSMTEKRASPAGPDSLSSVRIGDTKAGTAYKYLTSVIVSLPPRTQAGFDSLCWLATMTRDTTPGVLGDPWTASDEAGTAKVSTLTGFGNRVVIIEVSYEPKKRQAISAELLRVLSASYRTVTLDGPGEIALAQGDTPQPSDSPGQVRKQEQVIIGLTNSLWLGTEASLAWRE